MLPVLHFSGRFRFAMPGRNNDPRAPAVPFDPDVPASKVVALCGCDPAHYLEFEFIDVAVRQVTYGDGTTATAGDPVLGLPVTLSALFPDVSPSAVCSQLLAARMAIGDTVTGAVRKGLQSTPRLNVRPEGFGDQTVAAHVRTAVDLTSLADPGGSRFVSELGDARLLELHLHLNRYNRVDARPPEKPSTGDVFGTVRAGGPDVDAEGRRLRRRKLVVHPDLPGEGWFFDTFLGAPPSTGLYPPPFWIDIEGFYDLDGARRVITLHYLDFVPYLDQGRRTPAVDHYEVWWKPSGGPAVILGRFSGTHAEMVATAGLVSLPVPEGADLSTDGRVVVDVVRGAERQPLMVETEWDLVLDEERGFALPSTGSRTVRARVYRHNRPVAGHRVRMRAESRNRKSPVVATFADDHGLTDPSGLVSATVRAADLNAPGDVFDPATGGPATALPWDRYYGNFLFLEIDNPLRRNPWRQDATEVVELAVRVLHRVDESDIPEQPSFREDVKPLFAYHVRYFPWLHVRQVGGRYIRFLDLESLDEMRVRAREVLRRLSLPDDDHGRMPRSGDLPAGGLALLQRWIDTGMRP